MIYNFLVNNSFKAHKYEVNISNSYITELNRLSNYNIIKFEYDF